MYNVAELSSNGTGENGVQVETENGKFTFMCSRSQQNLEFGNFTLLFGGAHKSSTVKKCTKTYNARAGPLFFSLNPIVLSRCRCRRRKQLGTHAI